MNDRMPVWRKATVVFLVKAQLRPQKFKATFRSAVKRIHTRFKFLFAYQKKEIKIGLQKLIYMYKIIRVNKEGKPWNTAG